MAREGEAERGAKRRAKYAISSDKHYTRSYFFTRRASSLTTAIILVPHPNPFHDSLRSSQALYYLFWGIITWDFSNSENSSADWKIMFSIIIVSCSALMFIGYFFAMQSTAICEVRPSEERRTAGAK